MQFNNTTDKNGLIQQCEITLFGDSPFGQISNNASRLAIFTNYINEAVSRYGHIALMSDYNWEFDDRNKTDLPIGKTAIAINQTNYSFATEHSIITGVEIKDSANQWSALREIDERYFTENNISITQYIANRTGIPTEYTKVANSIILLTTPDWSDDPNDNTTWSLQVHFKRAPSYYTVADTTKVQGFTELQATYLSDYASWKYSSARSMALSKDLRQEVTIWEEIKIPELYSKRSAEHSKFIRPKYKTSR